MKIYKLNLGFFIFLEITFNKITLPYNRFEKERKSVSSKSDFKNHFYC